MRSLDNDRASPGFVILKHTIYSLRHDVVSSVRSRDNDRASPGLVLLFSCFFNNLKFSCFFHIVYIEVQLSFMILIFHF